MFSEGGEITSNMRASSVAVESKGNWTIMRDPKSKCVFYYNAESGVSQWSPPPGFEATGPSRRARRRSLVIGSKGQWELVRDLSYRTFYHNKVLNKSQWHKPAGFGDNVYDGETASRASQLYPDKTLVCWYLDCTEWGLEVDADPDAERVSYHNELLNEAQWDAPADFESRYHCSEGAMSRATKIEDLKVQMQRGAAVVRFGTKCRTLKMAASALIRQSEKSANGIVHKM